MKFCVCKCVFLLFGRYCCCCNFWWVCVFVFFLCIFTLACCLIAKMNHVSSGAHRNVSKWKWESDWAVLFCTCVEAKVYYLHTNTLCTVNKKKNLTIGQSHCMTKWPNDNRTATSQPATIEWETMQGNVASTSENC